MYLLHEFAHRLFYYPYDMASVTPEVRALIDGLVQEYPHAVFLRSVVPGLRELYPGTVARPPLDKSRLWG